MKNYNVDFILNEILSDKILKFSVEKDKGMLLKFQSGDPDTELIFGNLDIYLNGKTLRIENEKQLLECNIKNFFINKKIEKVEICNGDLVFSFGSQKKLVFKHSKNVENWELRWRSKITIISIPGGQYDFF